MSNREPLYRKMVQLKSIFENQVFSTFTDACGGTAKQFGNYVYNKYTVEDFAYGDDSYYWAVLGYFQNVVVPHKIAVYQSGIELTKLPIFKSLYVVKEDFIDLLWIHDASKFCANESFGYAFHNFKSDKIDPTFEKAWNHHKNHNPHHPEYWKSVSRNDKVVNLKMETIYIFEMVADWMGAGRTYGNSLESWLTDNLHKFTFHSESLNDLSLILQALGVNTRRERNYLTCKNK